MNEHKTYKAWTQITIASWHRFKLNFISNKLVINYNNNWWYNHLSTTYSNALTKITESLHREITMILILPYTIIENYSLISFKKMKMLKRISLISKYFRTKTPNKDFWLEAGRDTGSIELFFIKNPCIAEQVSWVQCRKHLILDGDLYRVENEWLRKKLPDFYNYYFIKFAYANSYTRMHEIFLS